MFLKLWQLQKVKMLLQNYVTTGINFIQHNSLNTAGSNLNSILYFSRLLEVSLMKTKKA